jgi:hypothetical protein
MVEVNRHGALKISEAPRLHLSAPPSLNIALSYAAQLETSNNMGPPPGVVDTFIHVYLWYMLVRNGLQYMIHDNT